MKLFLILSALITVSTVRAETLIDCTPKGQLIAENSLYITYSIEQHESEQHFLRLRKGYQTLAGESYIERLVPKQGFEFATQDKEFILSYISMEGQIVIVGKLWSEITPQKQTILADSEISIMLFPSPSPVSDLINTNEEIEGWTCQLRALEVLTSLKRQSPN